MFSRGRSRKPEGAESSAHNTTPTLVLDEPQVERWRLLLRQATQARLLGLDTRLPRAATGIATSTSSSARIPLERVQQSRERSRQREDQQSSSRVIPIVVAAIIGFVVTVLFLRLRRRAETATERGDEDILVDLSVMPTELGTPPRTPSDDVILIREEQ